MSSNKLARSVCVTRGLSDPSLMSKREYEFYALFAIGGDVPIAYLYEKYTGRAPPAPRQQQQGLAWIKHKLNTKLANWKQRVVPGDARNTYCIVEVE